MFQASRQGFVSSISSQRCCQQAFRFRKGPTSLGTRRGQTVPERTYASAPFHDAHGTTKIEKILLDNIKAAGPITFASYMQMCLSHPTHGYYANPYNPIFGARGDFITSPEISQVFGELVGVWLLSQWMQVGQARKLRLIELGPGRGTLVDDILRTLSRFPACAKAIQDVHLVETSEALRSVQEAKLRPILSRLDVAAHWHDGLDRIDVSAQNEVYSMVVAHEFFDALPFHLLQHTSDGWKEILIASADNTNNQAQSTDNPAESTAQDSAGKQTRFQTVLAATPLSKVLAASSPRFDKLPVGATLEVSPVAWSIARQIAQLVGGKNAGCALIIDYGAEHLFGNSFRAFKNHRHVDPFSIPGECDLTVNVDFAYLKEAASDAAQALGPIPQADFLTGMGLEQRVEVLARAAQSEERADSIRQAARRLVDRSSMGEQYKMLGLVGKDREIRTDTVWPFATS